MKRVFFQMIADSRFTDDIDSEIVRLKEGTKKSLTNLGATFRTYRTETLFWKDGTFQHRVNFVVDKDTKDITYKDIYSAVNRVKPVPYTIK